MGSCSVIVLLLYAPSSSGHITINIMLILSLKLN
ncbi:hypothetical protein vBSenH9_62 [Salmonella phage vB_Sen_H9]|uniref:Uncharacterized protein n=1 Tax=Salmonella phage vB_Sen_I1 TaxID=2723910 RepID=A0A7L5CH31_9CAUD|nr:hypothetical protein vBSenI1_83 [Salmonella phage vB_Sen_I1]QJA18027.1 hypothetical protein vBSenH9_62 [Salmonella phage vB_Sen_H9]